MQPSSRRPAAPEIYTLSLHDALPILAAARESGAQVAAPQPSSAPPSPASGSSPRSEEHTSELRPLRHLVCSLLPDARPPPRSTLFPYTTLFRSWRRRGKAAPRLQPRSRRQHPRHLHPVLPLRLLHLRRRALYLGTKHLRLRFRAVPMGRSLEHLSRQL